MPSGRHPVPTKSPLLELEVRICGRWDSWVPVPAHCQSLMMLLVSKGVEPARQGRQSPARLVHKVVLAEGLELLHGAEPEASDEGCARRL